MPFQVQYLDRIKWDGEMTIVNLNLKVGDRGLFETIIPVFACKDKLPTTTADSRVEMDQYHPTGRLRVLPLH
jgi:hypothetical protein